MTPIALLQELKSFTEECTKDLVLPCRTGNGDRAVKVYPMQLPEKDAENDYSPFIVLQLLTGKDSQLVGNPPESECKIRLVISTYSKDASKGALNVLELITLIRTALLKKQIIGGMFILRLPLEYFVYPDDTSPFFMGEMLSVWDLPAIEREVDYDC